jgi:uncharacterized protein Smg (DUF494 family)
MVQETKMDNVVIRLKKRPPYLDELSAELKELGFETDEIDRALNLLEYFRKIIGF